MKKTVNLVIKTLIIAGGGAAIVAGWLFYQGFSRTLGGYRFFKIYRPDGTLQREECFKNGDFIRITKEYSSEGNLKEEWSRYGDYRRYADNGKLQYELVRNKKDPQIFMVKTYFENGKLDTRQVYAGAKLLDKRGKPFNGVYRYYYQDGTLRKEETYKKGVMNGPWREYYENGKLRFEFIMAEGNKYIGGKSYYKEGQIESAIEQRMEGPVMVKYDLSGNPVSEYSLF